MRDTSSPSLAIAGVGNSSGVAGAIAGQGSYELGEFLCYAECESQSISYTCSMVARFVL
jgi:hypothetical protein